MNSPLLRLCCAVLTLLVATSIVTARERVRVTTKTSVASPLPPFMKSFLFTSDSAGNTFVTGTTFDVDDPDREIAYDIATLYTAPNRHVIRFTQFNGHNLEDGAGALTRDESGNVYVTGFSEFEENAFEAVTLKYSSAGAPVWTNYFMADPTFTTGIGIAADRNGNSVLIIRTFTNNFLVKLDAQGALAWQVDLGRPAEYAGLPLYRAVFDASGNVLVTGPAPHSAIDNTPVVLTIKFSGEGVLLWTNRYENEKSSTPVAITSDRHGRVFVAASSSTASVLPEWTVLGYSANGKPLWTNRLEAAEGVNAPVAITTDRASSVYVTGGRRPVMGTQQDFVRTVKYNSRGKVKWDNQQESDFGTTSLRFSTATSRRVTVVHEGVMLDTDANTKLLLRTEFHYQGR